MQWFISPVCRILASFKLIHQFALISAAFTMLSAAGAAVIWTKINGLQKANTEIIERQFPSRLALAEAKGSAAAFANLAYRAQKPDSGQLNEFKQMLGEEEHRFRYWLRNVSHDDPQTAQDLNGIEARFEKMLAFLRHFIAPPEAAEKEPRDFQLEYRFAPLRDDLDASLNHLENALGREAQDYAEYTQHVKSVELISAIEVIAAGYVTIVGCTILWATFGVGRPLQRLAHVTREIAEGRIGVQIPDRGYTEEISVMSRALSVFRDTVLFTRKLEEDNTAAKAQADAALISQRRRVAEIFRNDVMQAVMIVSGASTELQRSASVMRERAIETDRQAKAVVKMSGETVDTVGSLSQSSTQLSETVGTMNDQLLDAAQIALRAVADGRATSQRAHELAGAVEAIGKIADFISGVAYQINLLALNATIEAARCGEMGRGFAVVAGEVKHLAHATSGAAADIARQLAAVKGATDQVVKAIDVTVSGIGRIGEMAGVLEAAHSEKEIATRNISGCVDSVALNAKHISEVIRDVGLSTEETQRVADAMLAATLELSQQAERLLSQSHEFCEKIIVADAA